MALKRRLRSERGGCLAILGWIVLLFIAITVALYFYIKWKYVANSPTEELGPTPTLSEITQAEIKLDEFERQNTDGSLGDPLVLTDTELNALMRRFPEFNKAANYLRVQISGDKILGKLAMPLDSFGFPGGFVNGTAAIDLQVRGGTVHASLSSLDIKGNGAPKNFIDKINSHQLADTLRARVNDFAKRYRVERVEIKEGKVFLFPLSAKKTATGADN